MPCPISIRVTCVSADELLREARRIMANYELSLFHTSTEPTKVIRGFDALADAICEGQNYLDREWEITDHDHGDRLVFRHRQSAAEV